MHRWMIRTASRVSPPRSRPATLSLSAALEALSSGQPVRPVGCFRAHDIRGRVDHELTLADARALGLAVAAVLRPGRVAVGRDARLSSPDLMAALSDGLASAGVEVCELGLCGTEEVAFATDLLDAGAGLMVTGSRAPGDCNGFKLMGPNGRPLSTDEFRAIEARTAARSGAPAGIARGTIRPVDIRAPYVELVRSFSRGTIRRPLKVVVNAGNGAAGPTFDAILRRLPAGGRFLRVVRMNHAPDGTFPNGPPDPSRPETLTRTGAMVRAEAADLGVAWDGDFDRCVFFDETGRVVPGEYVVSLLARCLLRRERGGRVVHDPRTAWMTRDVVTREGGTAVPSRTGRRGIGRRLRETEALYAGEMSGHHLFRDFMCSTSGMIPPLLMFDLLATQERTLSDLVAELRAAHPSSGELTFPVADAARVLAAIESDYAATAVRRCGLDGLALEFADWRFNLRAASTGASLHLTVETRGRPELLEARTAELSARIEAVSRGPVLAEARL